MTKDRTATNNALPGGLKAYRRTPTFTEHTVPKGLLSDHKTKAGVWGQIHVESGQLNYVIPSKSHTQLLNPGEIGTVEPEQHHRVKPVGPVTFYVEFWR